MPARVPTQRGVEEGLLTFANSLVVERKESRRFPRPRIGPRREGRVHGAEVHTLLLKYSMEVAWEFLPFRSTMTLQML